MEQVVELFALACIKPVITDDYQPLDRKPADEMVKQCIVRSPHVMWDDYFKRRNSNHTDPLLVDSPDEEFDAKVSDIPSFTWVQLSEQKLGERLCVSMK